MANENSEHLSSIFDTYSWLAAVRMSKRSGCPARPILTYALKEMAWWHLQSKRADGTKRMRRRQSGRPYAATAAALA